jgi:hypothetical protein
MEKSLIDKVGEALVEACKPDLQPDIQLEAVEPDKVAGLVLSTSFAGQSPSERQNRLWRQLDASLTPYERTRIVFIVADTPDEHAALQETRRAS